MAYQERSRNGLTTIKIACDAWVKRGVVCGNVAMITMQSRAACKQFLFDLGWRLLRGQQVCSSCLRKKRVSFPRKQATQA